MSATNPDKTPAPHPASSTVSAGSEQPAWLRWSIAPFKRMILWLGVAAAGTYAMGSAANHFFAGGKRDQEANAGGTATVSGSASGSLFGTWWNPTKNSTDASTKDSGVTTGPAPSSSSSNGTSFHGKSIIPVDPNAEFSSGALIVNSPVPIGSNSSQTYALLGLSTSSYSAPSITPDSPVSSELHFSLSGDLNLVPVDNLSAGGLNVVTLTAIPEPSTAGLLAAGFAGAAFRRHRKSARIADGKR